MMTFERLCNCYLPVNAILCPLQLSCFLFLFFSFLVFKFLTGGENDLVLCV